MENKPILMFLEVAAGILTVVSCDWYTYRTPIHFNETDQANAFLTLNSIRIVHHIFCPS